MDDAWHERFATAAAQWRDLISAEHQRDMELVPQWAETHRQLLQKQQDLVADGRWRGGPPSLLAAIRIQHRELAMTAGLAWLLRPDGYHGMGSAVLQGLLQHVGMDTSSAHGGVRVEREERR